MGNCLKTQLKENVNNDNLKKFGVLTIYVSPQSSIHPSYGKSTQIKTNDDVDVYVRGTGGIGLNSADAEAGNTHVVIPANSEKTLHFKEGTYTVEIMNKYAITKLQQYNEKTIFGFNFSEMEFMNNLDTLYCIAKPSVGDTHNISKCSNITKIQIGGSPELLLSDFSTMTQLTELQMIEYLITGKKLGNITDWGNLINLQISNLRLGHVIDGDIKDFVAAQYSNGRTTGEINFKELLRVIPFNGHKYTAEYNGSTLTWENQNKIAVYAGSNTKSDCPTVYCMGYGTQSEAEAAFPGKTVIRVDA